MPVDTHEGDTVTMTCRPTAIAAAFELFRPHGRVHLSEPIVQH